MEKNKGEIIHFLANKYNLSIKEVEKIVEHQFKFVSTKMADKSFSTIRLPYFGKFTVDLRRVKHLNEKTNKKNIT